MLINKVPREKKKKTSVHTFSRTFSNDDGDTTLKHTRNTSV